MPSIVMLIRYKGYAYFSFFSCIQENATFLCQRAICLYLIGLYFPQAVKQNGDTLNQLKALNAEQERDVKRVRQRQKLLGKV